MPSNVLSVSWRSRWFSRVARAAAWRSTSAPARTSSSAATNSDANTTVSGRSARAPGVADTDLPIGERQDRDTGSEVEHWQRDGNDRRGNDRAARGSRACLRRHRPKAQIAVPPTMASSTFARS